MAVTADYMLLYLPTFANTVRYLPWECISSPARLRTLSHGSAHRLRGPRARLSIPSAVDYRIAAPPVRYDDSGTSDAVRAHLTKIGWEEAWIDGITDRIWKCEFETSVERVAGVVQLLEGLGLPTHWVCNMASRAPAFLGRDPQAELQPVIDYIQRQGIRGDALLTVLKDYPRLLLFTPTPDGSVLKYNDTYASVDVVEETNKGHVSYWREGTAFSTAPVSPRTPNLKM